MECTTSNLKQRDLEFHLKRYKSSSFQGTIRRFYYRLEEVVEYVLANDGYLPCNKTNKELYNWLDRQYRSLREEMQKNNKLSTLSIIKHRQLYMTLGYTFRDIRPTIPIALGETMNWDYWFNKWKDDMTEPQKKYLSFIDRYYAQC